MISSTSQAKGPSFAILTSERGGAERREIFDVTELTLGRVQGNDLMLPKGNVSKRHARLLYREGRFIVTDLNSTNGTYVNRRRISQATIVREGDKIYIGDFVLRIELLDEEEVSSGSGDRDSSGSYLSKRGAVSPVRRATQVDSTSLGATARALGESPALSEVSDDQSSGSAPVRQPPEPSSPSISEIPGTVGSIQLNQNNERRLQLISRAVQGAGVAAGLPMSAELDEAARERLNEQLEQQLSALEVDEFPEGFDLESLRRAAVNELTELGPLGALLDDESVQEIDVLRFDRIIERRGSEVALVELPFSSETTLRWALARLCQRAGMPLAPDEFAVERYWGDSLHLSALFGQPHAFAVLRRARHSNVGLEDLVRSGTISRKIASLLAQYVRHRANILLVGSREAGIAELRSALIALAPPPVFVIGADAFDCDGPHVVHLKASATNSAFEFAFRCSGARVVVGLSDPEGMIAAMEAMSAGADGVVASVHAPTASRALSRISGAVASRHAGMSATSARDWIASCVNLVVEVARLGDGRARVLRVAEPGFVEQGEIQLKDLFAFQVERTAAGGAIEGAFIVGGTVPRFIEELNARGVGVDASMFVRPPR